jgi:hypothetical protein
MKHIYLICLFRSLTAFAAHPARAQEDLLHIFGIIPNDGVSPESSLTFDSAGKLYGTTAFGGNSATEPYISFQQGPGTKGVQTNP